MKIILSRKGLDSSAGGRPSPILKDGSIFSIPIPTKDKDTPHRYSDVIINGLNAADMLSVVGAKNLSANTPCHFDPLLNGDIGLFGQAGNAQRELDNLGVGEGDLFLFFGWFRDFRTNKRKDYHHIFGWLMVNQVIRGSNQIREFCDASDLDHPHASRNDDRYRYNTLFVSRKKNTLNVLDLDLRGHGLFAKTNNTLILTELGNTRSNWLLPDKFFSPLSNPNLFESRLKWSSKFSNKLKCAGYGQEFVMDAEKNPTAKEWVRDILLNSEILEEKKHERLSVCNGH